MEERWKPIMGFEGYEVSDHGRVRSYWERRGRGKGNGKGWDCFISDEPQRILSCSGRAAGRYPIVCIGGKTKLVHRLIMEAFIGPCPEGLIVCHNDDNPENNHLSNLRYDTYQSNTADAWESGNLSSEVLRKLDETQVKNMRCMAHNGATRHELADLFGVGTALVTNICLGNIYTDCDGPIVNSVARKPRKLTDEQVVEIRRKLEAGAVGRDLAYQYDVHESMISRIKSGERRESVYAKKNQD